MATIAVVHAPYAGHVVPAMRLGAVLAAGGHRVVAWSPPELAHEAEALGLDVRPLVFRRPLFAQDWDRLPSVLAGHVLDVTDDLIGGLLEEKVDLVVHDTHAAWGRVAARWLGVPTVRSMPLFLENGPVPRYDGREEAYVAARDHVGHTLGVELGSPGDVVANAADITVCHTTPDILGRPPPDATWRFAGALAEVRTEDPAPFAGLGADDETDRPLVYATLGTTHNAAPGLFAAIVAAVAGAPVRAVVATGGRVTSWDMPAVPSNVVIVDRIMPSAWQRAVLARAAVCITHCGTGTAHDALFAGVPMVCMPIGGDQPAMARRVAELGAGEVLAERSPSAIRHAVGRLLTETGPRSAARRLSAHLRTFDGAENARRAVDELLA